MNHTLDNIQIIKQKDASDALGVAAGQAEQARFEANVVNSAGSIREITGVVVTGMGGSALAALLAKVWLQGELKIPFEIVRNYDLPSHVGVGTLVIASSYSGNTEETVSALAQAKYAGAQVGVISSGGKLIETAEQNSLSYVQLPSGLQPRMGVIYNLRGLLALLESFGVTSGKLAEVEALAEWLAEESSAWNADVPFEQNIAKQIAEAAVGRTPVFYGGALTAPVAYKWKISWNENAKNVAFWNEYPEFNHNEFLGWTSHPVEKPFAVFDIRSDLEHAQIQKRFEVSDRLLSGKRPKAMPLQLQGESTIAQMLWGSILADYASIYVAVLNGVDPTPVELIEKFKKELV